MITHASYRCFSSSFRRLSHDSSYITNRQWYRQRRYESNISFTGERVMHEFDYSEVVNQTACKMRENVRSYVAEYRNNNRNSPSCDRIQNQIPQFSSSENCWCANPPPIKLVGILSTTDNMINGQKNDTHGNERYSEQLSAICAADGISYEPWRVPPTKTALERAILHANDRLDVHGILVFYPVFDKLLTDNINHFENDDGGGNRTRGRKERTKANPRGPYKCKRTGVYYKSMDDYFRDLVLPRKDVEGYCRRALRMKSFEEKGNLKESLSIEAQYGPLYPCTALAVFRIVESFHAVSLSSISTNGKKYFINTSLVAASHDEECIFQNMVITIINRSEVVGLPLATMFSNQGATVYSIDKSSILQFLPNGTIRREPSCITMELCLKRSSVIVSGVPCKKFHIPSDWIPDNSIVINVATESNFDESSLMRKKPGVKYVPHVGRVTAAALEYNLICLHRNHHVQIE